VAINTAQERAAIATIATVWNPPSVIADGTIGMTDRQHAGWGYPGILMAGLVFADFPTTRISRAMPEVNTVISRDMAELDTRISRDMPLRKTKIRR
jgi:hypothetical protein